MKKEIITQYKASLNMLSEIIVVCPENLWNDTKYENSYWRIVYHTLFFTSLYLSNSPSEFTPWQKHIHNYESLGEVTSDNKPVIIKDIYSKNDMLEYLHTVLDQTDKLVLSYSEDEKCGFDWLPINKTELHLYNLRHIQHHVGQLTERLHTAGIKGIKWKVTV